MCSATQKGNIMQINNSVNTKFNMLYRNEKRIKDQSSSFDLKTVYSTNETVNEGKKIGTSDVQELYKANASNNKLVGTKYMGNALPVRTDGLEVWRNGEKMEWSATDEKYTDEKTGISYYVKDCGYVYMLDEDIEKLNKLCQETGEPWLKKYSEIIGIIRYLDDGTTVYITDSNTSIKSKDGKTLNLETASWTYEELMKLFKDLPKNGDYFDNRFWNKRMQNIKKG